MTELSGLSLSDLLAPSIAGDKDIAAAAAALDGALRAVTACIDEIIMLPRIDEMPEDIVDHLAGQFHADFYEPLGLDLDKKRALVKSALSWHRRKGTKSVLEEVIGILFLDSFTIEEWFEYGGEPYYFRISTDDPVLPAQRLDELIRAVYKLKNVRSWLESFIRRFRAEGTVYWGIAGRQTKKYAVDSMPPPDQIIHPAAVYVGTAGRHVKRYAVSGSEPPLTVGSALAGIGFAGRITVKMVIGSAQEVTV